MKRWLDWLDWLQRASFAVAGVLLVVVFLLVGAYFNLKEPSGIDWSQFIPNAILTIPTAVAIGLLLWQVQRTTEFKNARNAAIDEWQAARIDFMPLFHRSLKTTVHSPRDYSAQFEPIVERVAEYPNFWSWVRAAGSKEPELRSIKGILMAMPNLKAEGSILSGIVMVKVKLLADVSGRHSDIAAGVIWSLFGNSLEDKSLVALRARRFSTQIDAILADEQIRFAWTRYERSMATVANHYELTANKLSLFVLR